MLDTDNILCLFSWILITFGGIQLTYYWKYSIRAQSENSSNTVYKIQLYCHLFLVSQSFLKWCIRHLDILSFGKDLSFELESMISGLLWPMCLVLLNVQKNFQVENYWFGSRGILRSMWTLALVNEIWSYFYSSDKNRLELLRDLGRLVRSIFKSKYVFAFYCSIYLLIWILGFVTPGDSEPILNVPQNQTNETSNAKETDDEEKEKNTWKEFKRAFSFIKPFMWEKLSFSLRISLLACIMLICYEKALGILETLCYRNTMDNLHSVATEKDPVFHWEYIVIVALLKFMRAMWLFDVKQYFWTKITESIERDVKVTIFNHLHGLSVKWHIDRKTGLVWNCVYSGPNALTQLMRILLFDFLPCISDIITAIFTVAIMLNGWFGFIAVASMIIYIGLKVGQAEWSAKQRKILMKDYEDIESRSFDSLYNFETVKFFTKEEFETQRFDKGILKNQERYRSSRLMELIFDAGESFYINSVLMASSLYFAYSVFQGKFTVGDFTLFESQMSTLRWSFSSLYWLYRDIRYKVNDMEKLQDILEVSDKIEDLPTAKPIEVKGGKVEFKNVTFGYESEKTILKDISFVANPGETIAFVGQTGAGKSTLLRLLCRFFDIQEGEVEIDGQNIKSFTKKSVRDTIGVVAQDNMLFNDTIKFNIKYGRLDATEEEVESAAQNAEIHEHISKLSKGYESKVGERGLKLSGGEKQRISIARMILKNPKIIVLDEATSSLDISTEKKIQATLKSVCKGKTTLMVAHRLSTIVHADSIMVLKDGQIVERGSHKDLLALGGIYHKMWNQQFFEDQLHEDD